MKKLARYFIPVLFFIPSCAYLNINRINPLSKQVYSKIKETSHTISMNLYETKNKTQETLQSHINILSLIAQDQNTTLEQLCKEVNTQNILNKNISNKEYDSFIKNYLKTK